MVFLGGSREAFRKNGKSLSENRKFTGLRPAELAVNTENVAQIQTLSKRPIIANLLLTDEQLNLTRHVANINELQLPLITMEHNPAGRSHVWPRHLAGSLLRKPLAKIKISVGSRQIRERNLSPILQAQYNLVRSPTNRGDRRMIVEPRAPRIAAQLDDPSQFIAARCFPIARG